MAGPQTPTAAAVADDDWSGRTLGEFQLIRRIGRGGMGQVFLAEQSSLKRKVALKILRPELAANEIALKRFRAEAEAVARITHANIVQVYAIGEQAGVHYMALEYVEGRNLRDYLNRKGLLDVSLSVAIMRQVAAALQRAGEHGFVHRDVKPENILLTRKGEVKVADFGLSRCFTETGQPLNLTQSGIAMGTPLYMSPEQVQGKAVDPRSDIYSFGVTCYHLLSGQPPFKGSNAFDVALQHVQNEPPPLAGLRPELPADLVALVHKMMAKKPDDRPQTAKEVLRELNRIRESASGTAATALPFNSGVLPASGAAATSQFEVITTQAFARPRSTHWMVGAIAGVAALGIMVAAFSLRFLASRLMAHPAAKTTASAPREPVQPVVSNDEHFAREAAQQFANPATWAEVQRGLPFQIELATYYFKHHRIDDAEKFLHGLQGRTYKSLPALPKGRPADHPYKLFANLGLGIVLAERDKARESVAVLAAALDAIQPTYGLNITGLPQPINDPELRRTVASALVRDAVNLKLDKFTGPQNHLEQLRKPPSRPFPLPKKIDKS